MHIILKPLSLMCDDLSKCVHIFFYLFIFYLQQCSYYFIYTNLTKLIPLGKCTVNTKERIAKKYDSLKKQNLIYSEFVTQ
jgi:hypothetical protein